MSDERRCGQCGGELAAGVPHGLCPACLLKRGLETQTAGFGSGEPSNAEAALPTPAELAPHFPELEILDLVGRGGMGVVYKARQKHLDRLVALKILSPSFAREPAFAERFTREARALAMLSHPHVVAVYDFGRSDGLYYFLMEFVDGLNLRRLLDQGQITPQQSLAIVPQICEALQFAHDRGVVHRDIKPENILLDRQGQVKIADFGLAKLIGRPAQDPSLTGSGQVMGTPLYMAPEQVEHPQEVDHRADIYSLGVVFYQMLTGELPLGRFVPPSRKVQIDVRLDDVVLHALEKQPERRYQHASEVKSDVDNIAAGSRAGDVVRPSPSADETTQDRARRDVRGPSIGLVVTSVLNWLTIFALAPYMAAYRDAPQDIFLLGVAILALGSGVILIGALKMQRLESLFLARLASVLAMFVGPGYLVGWPVGIWSLVVLSRREVVAGFRQRRRAKDDPPDRLPPRE